MSSGLGGKKNERSRRGDQPTGASTDQVLAVGQKGMGAAARAGPAVPVSTHRAAIRVERSKTTHTSYTELDREDPKGHVDAGTETKIQTGYDYLGKHTTGPGDSSAGIHCHA